MACAAFGRGQPRETPISRLILSRLGVAIQKGNAALLQFCCAACDGRSGEPLTAPTRAQVFRTMMKGYAAGRYRRRSD